MVDYIADYLQDIRSRRVFPDVQPGYMQSLVPDACPESGEEWDAIFNDVERVIMPGMTHWQSPHMHAYFPALNSAPSLLGDMLADAIGCLGFTWASSPAATELETIVMDWLGKMLGLPAEFLHSNTATMGGGVIQTTASDSTFVSLLAARSEAIKLYRLSNPDLHDAEINARLVGYCSDQAHSSVEKAGLIGLVKLRLLPTDEDLSLRGDTLRNAINEDRENGLVPFYLCATLGTTGSCAFDNLKELGVICEEEELWMHIDAAYAGTSFICPEFRHHLEGAEYGSSFAFNPSKWMMVHFDCTAMWVKNSRALHRTFNVQPLYLKHENTGAAIDYMHWQVPLSKRFRALKLWFVLRSFGVSGLQKHVRRGVQMAKYFENLVNLDERFEIPATRHLGMVVFRLKGEDELTELLLKRLNQTGQVHMVPASIKGKYIIRFTVTSTNTTEQDIERDWSIIQTMAGSTSADTNLSYAGRLRREGLRRKDFGMSLILSNVPMSPKFINGSFAALFDTNDIIVDYARELGRNSVDFNGRPIRLCPRKKLREHDKQFSFDLSRMPPSRRTTHMSVFKQASLDSKIEEIFDSSFDSDSMYELDTEGFTNGDSAPAFVARADDDSKKNAEKIISSETINGLGEETCVTCHVCGHVMTP
ncbi:hypothetical protein CAPTEDRAFT_180248 [Capitella teleta]|uniref:Histidine decarboxylase n=1 Tax=Capitella teleta TaxID=283909 RepID=N1PBB9_CAPTE|nr:hypothetical protein CAPTEDRAFT_180248 [Capitella teleta]|eukprot:ELU18925.1 hypothetical protein CAPTEDRAFT_180248 [Capitella teleta]